jgi:hypothetical protein
MKHFFDERCVRVIARELCAAHSTFDERAFVEQCLNGLDALELTARGWHIAEALAQHLPEPFALAARIIVRSLGGEAAPALGGGPLPASFRYLPHVFFVQRYRQRSSRAGGLGLPALARRCAGKPTLDRAARAAFTREARSPGRARVARCR